MSVNDSSGVRGWLRSASRLRTTWFGLLFLMVWSFFVAGCGGDDTNIEPPVVDSGADVKKDTGTDAGIDHGNVLPDAKNDGDAIVVNPDADAKVGSDGDAPVVSPDVGPDVPSDRVDAVVDVQADRGPDVVDAGPPTLVSITVTPTNPSIAKGTSKQFTATGNYSNNTTQDLTNTVTWASGTSGVATINGTGLATSPNNGSTGTSTITAWNGTISGFTTLTVTPAVLVSIAVTPPSPSIADGFTQQFTATGTYSDQTTQPVTNATWSSSLISVATINGAGLASSQGTGTSTITAAVGTIGGTATLNVTTAILVSISVTPSNPKIAATTTAQFKATGIFSNGSTQDLTTSATWTSSDETKATVSDTAGSKGFATGVAPGPTNIRAAATTPGGSVTGSTILTVSNAVLQSIALSPQNPSIAKGTKQQFTAIGTFDDGTTQDITQSVTWFSVTEATATVSNAVGSKGLATSVAEGDTTIQATQSSITGSTNLHVSAAALQSISVTPSSSSIAKGTTQPFTAIGIYSDNSTQDLTTTATWSSSSLNVGTISNAPGSQGVATGVGLGSTTITATSTGIAGFAVLNVTIEVLKSIAVSPTNPSIANGTTRQFTAIGTFTDNSTQDLTATVAWESLTTNVATISSSAGSDGLATSFHTGSTIIRASQGGFFDQTTLTVTDAVLATINVSPANQTIAKGTTLQFTATGIFTDNTTQNLTATVTWASTMGTVATISNNPGSQGLVTAVGQGLTSISATQGGISGTTNLNVTPEVLKSIDVTPTNPSIAKGTQVQFTATGTFTDNSTQDLTDQVTWGSSDGTKASVSNAGGSRGLATALAAGPTTISATQGIVTGTTVLTVTPATLESIAVTPASPSIAKGTKQQFSAIGTYSDGNVQDLTTTVAWSSDTLATATISNAPGTQGEATSVAQGNTLITATLSGKSGSTNLHVTVETLQTITIVPVDSTIANGTTQQFRATGHYSDLSTQELTTQVTWQSSLLGVAVIVPSGALRGLATATGMGTTTITAKLGTITGTTTLKVTDATLDSITVTPDNPSIANGTKLQFTATGHYSDGTTQDLTKSAAWDSSDIGVATISNAVGTEGEATSVAPNGNPTTITATFGGKSGSTSLTVTNAALTSITVLPANRNIPVGGKLQYSAIGNFTGGSTQDISTQVAWSSSNVAIAIISNTPPKGEATAIASGGPIQIKATFNAVVGQTDLTVITP